jgi:hypothetical protein
MRSHNFLIVRPFCALCTNNSLNLPVSYLISRIRQVKKTTTVWVKCNIFASYCRPCMIDLSCNVYTQQQMLYINLFDSTLHDFILTFWLHIPTLYKSLKEFSYVATKRSVVLNEEHKWQIFQNKENVSTYLKCSKPRKNIMHWGTLLLIQAF